jgi:hypothetical protein
VGAYRDGSGGLWVVEGGVATAGHHLRRQRRRGSFGAEQSASQRKRQGGRELGRPREVKRERILLLG